MEQINNVVNQVNGVLFSNTVVYMLLATGVLFTMMTVFGQYRALTHGVAITRGKYDDKDDPGAINHFQALSAALSATVGLGNIGGVAAAVALGGPGAVFWMWVIGVIGMSLKMTEVTQSMLYRNTKNPENPHGGPMFVVRDGFAKAGLPTLGVMLGGIFCLTLILSAITGGNMFQAWNVCEVTSQYTPVPRIAIGIILAVLVGLVIIGGIKRIGTVAGTIVPFMCVAYVLAAIAVLIMKIDQLPSMLGLIVRHGVGLAPDAEPVGAFLGGSFGYAALFGIKRALFSSEAGQGSSPIAHSAAKTDEPVREGIVAGLEPFIDTIVVCTMTALVLLSTGAWNRGPEAAVGGGIVLTNISQVELNDGTSFEAVEGASSGDARVFMLTGTDEGDEPTRTVLRSDVKDVTTLDDRWVPSSQVLPARSEEAERTSGDWRDGQTIFVLVEVPDTNPNTNARVARMYGHVRSSGEDQGISWDGFEAAEAPRVPIDDSGGVGIYGDYVAANLTAHAFDRAFPGLGMILIIGASWLFAVSTMISWSYYGEQGIVYLFGEKLVMPYRVLYCAAVFVSSLPFIKTEAELDMWTTLGLGAMLVANIPIMLLFGVEAMKHYHDYGVRLKRGAFKKRG